MRNRNESTIGQKVLHTPMMVVKRNTRARGAVTRISAWKGLVCLLLACLCGLALKTVDGATYNETYQMFYTYGDWTYVKPHLDVQYNNIYIDGANRGYWRLSAHAGQYLMLENGSDYLYLRDSNRGNHGFIWLFVNPSSSCYDSTVKNTNGKKVNGEGSVCNYNMVLEDGGITYLSVWQGNMEWNCDNTIYALTSRCFKNDGTQIDGQTQWRASVYSIGDRRNVMTIANGGGENFIGRITGSTRIVKNGGGWQYFTASDNDFSGGLQINGGCMVGAHEGDGRSLGSGTIQMNGGCIHNGNYNPTYSNAISVTATSSFRAGWGKNMTFTGQITGGGRLDIADDSGTVILTNTGNNWSGGLRIGGAAVENGSGVGRVQMGGNNTLGSGTVSFGSASSFLEMNGCSESGIAGLETSITSAVVKNSSGTTSTLTLNGGGSYSFSGVIQNGITLVKGGTGTQTLANVNTYTGGTTMSGGTLKMGASGSVLGSGNVNFSADSAVIDLNGKSLSINGLTSSNNTLYNHGFTNSSGTGTLTVGNSSGNELYYGYITGNIAVTKTGSDMLRLAYDYAGRGKSTFTGDFTLAGGNVYVYYGKELGSGTVRVTTAGTQIVNNGGAYTITTTESSRPVIDNNIVMSFDNASQFVIRAGWNNVGYAGLETSMTLRGNITGTGGILYGGEATPGYIALSGNNTYTGNTTIGNGDIDSAGRYAYWGFIIDSNSAFGANSTSVTIGKNTRWEFNTSSAARSLSNSSIVLNANLMLMATDGNHTARSDSTAGIALTASCGEGTGANAATIGSAISGTGALYSGKGTVILTGSNSYTGATNITAGTLQIGNGGSSGSLGNGGAVSVASGTMLKFNRSDDGLTVNNAISGAGTIEQVGSGSVTLTGNGDGCSGAVNVRSGLMIISPTASRTIENSSFFGTATTTVFSGATLRYAGSEWAAPARNAQIIIDGGTVQTARDNYFGLLTLKNGALLEKYASGGNMPVRVGYVATPVWNVEGTNNRVTVPVTMVISGDKTTYTRFTINTAANSDLTVAGFNDHDTLEGMELYKTGAGSMTINGVSTYWGNTTIEGGTVLVSGSGTVGYDATSTARSGNIAVRDGSCLEFAKTAGTTQTITGNVFVGRGTNAATSVMKLTSGTITTTSLCSDTYIGWGGDASTSTLTGKFIQDGGTFNSYHWLNIGEYATGQYDLNAGTLNARMLCVGRRGDGTMNIAGGAVNFVDSATHDGVWFYLGANWDNMVTTGVVNQTGGTVTTPQIKYGDCSGTASKDNIGRYNLAGGKLVLTGALTATHDLSSYRRHEMNVSGTGQLVLNSTETVSGLSFTMAGSGDGTGAVLFQRAASINNAITMTGDAAIGVESGITGTMAGVISGSGKALTKAGEGLLLLTAANTYTGGTTISGGTLKLGTAGAVTTNTSMAIAEGGTFDMNGYDQTLSMLTGYGSGAGTVTNTQNGTTSTLIVSNASLDTYAGMVEESGTGKIRLVKQNTDKLEMKAAVAFSGGLDVTGGTLLFSGAANIDSTVSVTGSSTLIFTGNSVVGNTISVSNGTLQMGNNTINGAIGTADVALANAGTLKFQYLLTKTFTNTVTGSGTIEQNSVSTVNLSSDLTGFNGAVSVLKGTLNTMRGFDVASISVSNGTLKNSAVTLEADATSLSGGTLNLCGGNLTSDVTVTGGSLKLSDGSTLAGDVFMRSGSYSLKNCTLDGNFIAYEGIALPILQSGVEITGTIYRGVDSVGSLSTSSIGGAFYFDEGTTMQLTMPSGSQAVEPEDLSLVNFSEMTPASSELISVTSLKQLSTGDVVTTDEAVALTKLALNDGMTLDLTVNDRPAATESGWADLLTTTDGIVGDASAFDTLNLNFGTNTVSYSGDLSSFLQVNGNSLQINSDRLRGEYNTAVPEPSTWLLLVLGVFGLTACTRRRRAVRGCRG